MTSTSSYKAIIIDDEPKLREVLQIKLRKHCPTIEIVSSAIDAPDAYDKITEYNPDLIFLDIAMPGESGFDLLDRFTDIRFEVIFVTGYNEYALDALKISAVDYLLKPVNTADLIAAVEKATSRIEARTKIDKYEVLKHNLHNIGDQNTKISIPGSDAYEFIRIGDIIRCEGWDKYTRIHLKSGAVVVSSYNLGVFRDMLESYHFFTTHKSHLINTTEITRYLKDGTVVMSDDSKVPVARRRKEEFMNLVVKSL